MSAIRDILHDYGVNPDDESIPDCIAALAAAGGIPSSVERRDAVEIEWVIDPERVHSHVGHDIEIVTYANQNLAIECVSCGTVLADIDFWKE